MTQYCGAHNAVCAAAAAAAAIARAPTGRADATPPPRASSSRVHRASLARRPRPVRASLEPNDDARDAGFDSTSRSTTMSRARRGRGNDGRESWMDDDVDEANAMSDARFADLDASYVGLRMSDDEGSESEEDEMAAMGVSESDESDESDDEDDEDDADDADDADEDAEDDAYSDSEEAALARAMKAQKKRLEGKVKRDAAASDESESEGEEDGFGIKGKKKRDFYGDDDVDHEGLSDEEDRQEEEKEVRRVRKLMAEEMRAEDFGVESDEEEEEEFTLGAKAANLRRGDDAAKNMSVKRSSRAIEIETLTAEERAERVAAEDEAAAASDAPELVALTNELTKTLGAIEESVEPLVTAARDGAFATADGISYLDTKYLLMLSYCSSIVFYLLLKAEGRSVKDHPVIERLVEIRLYLEKLRPIDKKLQYQIDKLLKLASASDRANAEKGDDEGDDPLRFAPNPKALVSKTDEGEDGGDGVYRPPKMLPTAMDYETGGRDAKELRRNKEIRRRAGRSQLIKELAREVGEAPEELGTGDEDLAQSAFAKREIARMEARARVEEDLFTRVPLSKQERKRQKASTRNVNSLMAVGDFGDDVADLVERTEVLDKQTRKRRLADTVADGYKPQTRDITSGEIDVPIRDSLGERRNKYERGVARALARAQRATMEAEDEPRRPYIDDDEEYVAAENLRDRKRKDKADKYAREPGLVVAPEEDISGKREIGQKIMSNRGLTPHRNKETKNPRVRLRGKHARAVTRRKGSIREAKEQTAGYGGELTGVKTSVVKSRKFA